MRTPVGRGCLYLVDGSPQPYLHWFDADRRLQGRPAALFDLVPIELGAAAADDDPRSAVENAELHSRWKVPKGQFLDQRLAASIAASAAVQPPAGAEAIIKI